MKALQCSLASSPSRRYFAPRFLVIVLVGLLLPFGACKSTPFYLGGIQIHEESATQWAKNLRQSGFTSVAVTIYSHQGDWNSDTFWYDLENKGVETEIRAAKAEGLKVVLILRTALDHAYEANQFLWHGMIMPRSDSELRTWTQKYRTFATHWATFAEREGVDVLGIGSELNTMTATRPLSEMPPLLAYYLDAEKQARERALMIAAMEEGAQPSLRVRGSAQFANATEYASTQQARLASWAREYCGGSGEEEACLAHLNARRATLEGFWRTLIEDIREHYSGKLTYAANFDQFHEVGFWDALDLMGINAYFQLRRFSNVAAHPQVLELAWERVFAQIDTVRRQSGAPKLPVLFTELGYTSREFSSLQPWSSEGLSLVYRSDGETELIDWKQAAPKPEERVAALQALRAVAAKHPDVLQGILYWKLSSHEYHRDIEPFISVLHSEQDAEFNRVLRSFHKLGDRER